MATSKQASKHTHAHAQCSSTSVGLTQARPNKGCLFLPSMVNHVCMCTYYIPFHEEPRYTSSQ